MKPVKQYLLSRSNLIILSVYKYAKMTKRMFSKRKIEYVLCMVVKFGINSTRHCQECLKL